MNIKFSTNYKFKRMLANILSIFVILAMAFLVTGAVSAQEPAPFIRISTSNDYLQADNFTPNALVTFTAYTSQGSSDVVLEISRQTDETGLVFIDGWEHGADLVPGNYIVATDGINEKQLVLEPLTIEVFDPDTDLVTGTATPGQDVWVLVGNSVIGYPGGMWVVADDNGIWIADFSSTFDFTYDMWGGVVLYDEDGDFTVYHLGPSSPPPNPRFTVFPEWEFFDGLEWPDGATVSISVAGKPGCSLERESWGGFFNGNFPEGCNIEASDIVTFNDGTTNRWHEVRNLYVTDVGPGENTVTGKADAGETVYVWPHDGWFEPLQATVGESGVWQVDLDNAGYTIREDSEGRSEIRDEMGNATASDWHVTHPRFTVFPEWEWFDGNDWPNEAMVTITVEGKEDVCTTVKESWGYFFNGSFGEECDLEIGDTVTFTDGEAIRTHTVQNLTVTKANHEDDTIKGMADPGAEVYIWPHATGEQQLAIAKTMGMAMGNWHVDFSGIYDLTPGECGRSEIRDEFANSTAVDWCISNPRIIASESGDWFWTAEFKPGDLDISIYESPDGANLLWSGQQVADESGFTFVGYDIHGQNLLPGNYLVVTDGDSQKSLVLQPVSVTVFETEYEFMAGFAPPGSDVWAAAGPEDWQERIMVMADPVSGAWFADFAEIDFDITEDMRPWSYAHIYDEDGDANEGSTPPPGATLVVITNQPDWVNSGVTVSAGQSFTIQAVGLMNPCSDTYPNGADYCIFYTPLGAEGVVPYENEFGIFPGPGLRFMALLGRIDDGEPLYVGAGGTFTAEQAGTLWFTPNDNLRMDNQGTYSVLVWLEP